MLCEISEKLFLEIEKSRWNKGDKSLDAPKKFLSLFLYKIIEKC